MSTSMVIAASAAQGEGATLFVGFELSKSTWLIGLYAPELGTAVSRHKVDGGDLGRAQELIGAAKRRLEKAGKPVRVVSIYEAGYDGFWLHRALQKAGVENRVIDAASVPVDRRARRVKTDRLDLEQLIRMLLALERGETRACRVVRVPSSAAEDAKRQHRERAVLVAERTAHGNRITGLLMLLGIRGVNPRRRDFVAHLETLVTATGEPLPPHTRQALTREYERLCVSERQIKEIEATQAAVIQSTSGKAASLTEEGRGASGMKSSGASHAPQGAAQHAGTDLTEGGRLRRSAQGRSGPAARRARHGVPAARLADSAGDSGGRHRELRRHRPADRLAQGGAGGGVCLRVQPSRRGDPVPSRGAHRWRCFRLSMGRAAQAGPARAGSRGMNALAEMPRVGVGGTAAGN